MRPWFNTWVRKIPVIEPWRRDSLPTPVFIVFPEGSDSKESACNVGDLGWEDPLEEGMATHSCILAWRIPWTEEPGGLPSMGSQRIGHDWAIKHSTGVQWRTSEPQNIFIRCCWILELQYAGIIHFSTSSLHSPLACQSLFLFQKILIIWGKRKLPECCSCHFWKSIYVHLHPAKITF